LKSFMQLGWKCKPLINHVTSSPVLLIEGGSLMIGVLCSEHMEKSYAEKFHYLFKKAGTPKGDDIIVFTILNIDFTEKVVTGSLISSETIDVVKVPMPSIIFNLSLQRDMNCIKARKKLEEMNEISLINDSNRYDQWMIMDMLHSSKRNQKFLLPYHIYDKAVRNFKPEDNQAYITMPSRGASLSRVIFAVPEENTDRIKGTQYFKKGHICDYIDASMCQTRWIFIEVPKLITHYNHPVIVRSYLQRSSDKTWKVLGRNVYPKIKLEKGKFTKSVEEASLSLIRHTSRFLPSMGIAFIDFILSTEGNPYFLHFSGFEQSFFDIEQSEEFYRYFYKNLLKLASDYRHMKKED
jgi:hypothetical protein